MAELDSAIHDLLVLTKDKADVLGENELIFMGAYQRGNSDWVDPGSRGYSIYRGRDAVFWLAEQACYRVGLGKTKARQEVSRLRRELGWGNNSATARKPMSGLTLSEVGAEKFRQFVLLMEWAVGQEEETRHLIFHHWDKEADLPTDFERYVQELRQRGGR